MLRSLLVRLRHPRRALVLLGAVGAMAGSACGHATPTAFERSKAEGDRAHAAGRYGEAASAYAAAAHKASRDRDRDEALYREAVSEQRNHDAPVAEATLRRIVERSPEGERTERAEFDLSLSALSTPGRAAEGLRLLEAFIVRHPNGTLARRALHRRLEMTTTPEAIDWLQTQIPRLASTPLDEDLRYTLGHRLLLAGRLVAARDAFLLCAERHPYPFGSLFDDALYNASLVEEKLGAPERAILHLRSMLSHREHASLNGSYERPRYSMAQKRIAELLRDKLRDHAQARREFHRLYAEHTTSILRDDALWQEARLAQEDGETQTACNLANRLIAEFPQSRYAPCAGLLCPQLRPSAGGGACHDYIRRASQPDEESPHAPVD